VIDAAVVPGTDVVVVVAITTGARVRGPGLGSFRSKLVISWPSGFDKTGFKYGTSRVLHSSAYGGSVGETEVDEGYHDHKS